MTLSDKREYKIKLRQHAVEIIRERIAKTTILMENAQASANSEEKSSVGDKYETTRAMSHLEKDMYAKQLAANNMELAALMSIDCSAVYHSVKPGCLVISKNISFFVAAGLGKISFDGINIYFLSPIAPFAKSMMNKVDGDRFVFNNEEMIIEGIY